MESVTRHLDQRQVLGLVSVHAVMGGGGVKQVAQVVVIHALEQIVVSIIKGPGTLVTQGIILQIQPRVALVVQSVLQGGVGLGEAVGIHSGIIAGLTSESLNVLIICSLGQLRTILVGRRHGSRTVIAIRILASASVGVNIVMLRTAAEGEVLHDGIPGIGIIVLNDLVYMVGIVEQIELNAVGLESLNIVRFGTCIIGGISHRRNVFVDDFLNLVHCENRRLSRNGCLRNGFIRCFALHSGFRGVDFLFHGRLRRHRLCLRCPCGGHEGQHHRRAKQQRQQPLPWCSFHTHNFYLHSAVFRSRFLRFLQLFNLL